MARHIKFVALCHDNKVLASHTHWDREYREDYEAQLGNVFKTGQWGELVEGNKKKVRLYLPDRLANVDGVTRQFLPCSLN